MTAAAWWNGSAILWDLETDGINPQDARIITAATVYCFSAITPETETWLVKPGRPIPAEASAVHGIGTDHAAAHGMDRAEAIEEIARSLCEIHRGATRDQWGDPPVIGHNVGKYDLTVLDRELRRTGVGSLGVEKDRVCVRIDGREVGSFHVIDSLVLDKAVDPYRRGSRKLVDVAAHYGVPIRGDAHTADADALAAGRIVWAIARRCGEPSATLFERYRDRKDPGEIAAAFYALRLMDLPGLHRAQVVWAAEQARGLAAYFRRTGKGDPDGVSGAWPLEPVTAPDGGAPGIVTVDTGGLL